MGKSQIVQLVKNLKESTEVLRKVRDLTEKRHGLNDEVKAIDAQISDNQNLLKELDKIDFGFEAYVAGFLLSAEGFNAEYWGSTVDLYQYDSLEKIPKERIDYLKQEFEAYKKTGKINASSHDLD